MATDKKNMYFAAKDASDVASTLLSRANSWYYEIDSNGYLDKLRAMYNAYHGNFYGDFSGGHRVSFGGEQGELTNVAVNHLRNLATNMVVMITATRPSLQARAVNSDSKSQIQAKLANGLLDYYLKEKRLEVYLHKAAEYATVLGAGYIKMEWNATAGNIYDYDYKIEIDEEGNEVKGEEIPIYEGDVQFSNLSPFDVVFDPSREDNEHDWVMSRSFKLRYDLIAKYPELERQLMAIKSKDDLERWTMTRFSSQETDLVPVYEFYHRKSESMPDGRYILFADSESVMLDGPLPYKDIPIYRIAYGTILGTPFGYTPLFDILPIQEAINSLHSTILTNQTAFGVQNIGVPRGSSINISEVSGGLNLLEFDPQSGPPVPLNFTSTPPEIFNYLTMLEKEAETISGVNSVSRGNPEQSLKSGTALALVQSMSLQYMSGFQQSYVRMLEDVGTGLINMLKSYASVPRVASVAGIKNYSYMKEFTGDDLDSINRIIVDVGNPLSRSTAGRVQMAEQMMQMGVIKNPQQYLLLIDTGSLDTMVEGEQSELLTIRKENEYLLVNRPVTAVITDDHAMHIKEHKTVLADPDLRMDPDLVARCTIHMQEHIDLLRNVDPDLLTIIGSQPLAPKGGSPANQPNNQPSQPNQGGVSAVQQQPEMVSDVGMPNMPTPPPPFENQPMTPEQSMAQNTAG